MVTAIPASGNFLLELHEAEHIRDLFDRIVVDEEIEVAVGPVGVTCPRAKMKARSRRSRAERRRTSQGLYQRISVHGTEHCHNTRAESRRGLADRRSAQAIVTPPSATITVPVMKDDAFEAEEGDDAADLVRLADAAQGRGRDGPFETFRILPQGAGKIGLDQARARRS